MADSIRSKGVQVPLKARPRGGDAAEIIWGERRWRGAMLVYQGYDDAAGNHYAPQPDLLIPVMVEEMSDEEMFELMMLENLQRQDLAPSEEGAGYARMMEDWGLSTRDVSARLGVPQSRITRFARLLHLPVSVRDRVDAGDLPLYVALEALRVPAEWLGGDARLEALRVAEEAGSAVRAHEMVEGRFLRPAREAGEWESEDRLAGLEARYGAGVERLPYRLCRELFPGGTTLLTPVTAGHFVLGAAIPKAPVVHFPTALSWAEMAEMWGAPRYVACDGEMGEVLLTRADLVAEAARTRHTWEVEVVRDVVSGSWRWRSTEAWLADGDRVALLKLSGVGDVPQGYVAGRIYEVHAGRALESGGEGEGCVFDLVDGRGGRAVPLHGATVTRLGVLEVSRCPFLPGEGRVGVDALRMESADAEASASAASTARRAAMVEMLGRAEMAIRGTVAATGGHDGLLAQAVHFLAVAGAVGCSHADHPGNQLMALLELPEEAAEEAQFSTWQGLSGADASRAGVESFAVCAWLVYWLSVYEGDDLASCDKWLAVVAGYGI